MEEYLVESHLGGLYTSIQDPEDITEYCDQCGDSDTIITSWDNEEENALYNALKETIIEKYKLDSKRLLYNLQEIYNYDIDTSIKEAIEELINITKYNKNDNEYFLEYLLDDEIINKKEHKTLSCANTKHYNKEIKLINELDASSLKKEAFAKIRKRK